MDEEMAAINKNLNLFKEKVASKDELFDVLARLKRLDERMAEVQEQQVEMKERQNEHGDQIKENEELSKDNAAGIEELRN